MISFAAGFLAADPTPAPTSAASGSGGTNWLTIGMIVVLAVLVFFMWRNSRKRRADQAKIAESMVPGAEVMTNFGLFGKVASFDSVSNTAELEVAPGVTIKVHRQTLVRVVDPAAPTEAGAPKSVEEAMAIAEQEQKAREAGTTAPTTTAAPEIVQGEPRYGERLPETGTVEQSNEGEAKH